MRLQSNVETSSSPEKCAARISTIAAFLKPGMQGAELGVFKGAFLDHLLTTKPKRLFAVDPWYRAGPEWEWAKGEKSTLRAFIKILDEFAEEIAGRLLEPRVEFSQQFLQSIPNQSLDWVYIDTTHRYEQTKTEIDLSLQKVRSGGLIMGDDYTSDPMHKHYGVYRAVQENVAAKRLELLVDGENRQFVTRVP